MSAPPELLQFFHGILKSPVPTQRQAAGYLNVMKQRLTLAVPQFNLEKRKTVPTFKKNKNFIQLDWYDPFPLISGYLVVLCGTVLFDVTRHYIIKYMLIYLPLLTYIS